MYKKNCMLKETFNFNSVPFGIELKYIMSIVACICTGQTDSCRISVFGCACITRKYGLPLHVTL